MEQKMSVTKALTQIKLLEKRIEKETDSAMFVGLYQEKNKGVFDTVLRVAEFEKEAMGSFQSIMDLISLRKRIKEAVLRSNSESIVRIAGNSYTVVEAIERKNSIKHEKALLSAMKSQYSKCVKDKEKQRAQLELEIYGMLEKNLSSDKQSSKHDYDNIAKPFIEDNELKISDPLKISKKIADLDKEIDEFLAEVDHALSESNARTEITIS